MKKILLSFILLLISMKNAFSLEFFDYKRGLLKAKIENKHVLLNVCDNSYYCNKLEKDSFNNQNIKNILEEKFVIIKINPLSNNLITVNNKIIFEKDYLENLKIDVIPSIYFMNSNGEFISGIIKGFIPPDKLGPILEYIYTDSYKTLKFKDFLSKKGN
ncbi:MAG: hypothetical protein KatS3mg068_2580 [Candidatus Sericytochromatia bacterium]|nr:MAG: hypothetical protein KatS3mg068_2580 [Candidatus Sericytochromatia bacterium]